MELQLRNRIVGFMVPSLALDICRDFLSSAENVKAKWGKSKAIRRTPRAGTQELNRFNMWLFTDCLQTAME